MKALLAVAFAGSLTLTFAVVLHAWAAIGHPFVGFFHCIITFALLDWFVQEVKR